MSAPPLGRQRADQLQIPAPEECEGSPGPAGATASQVRRLPEVERRRTRLLAWILVTLIALAVFSLAAALTVDHPGSARAGGYTLLIAAVILALTIALILDLRLHYAAAALLAVAVAVFAPWGAALLDPTVLHGDAVPLMYVAVSILLSGILLSARVTAGIAAVQIVALAIVLSVVPSTRTINWPSLLVLVLFVASLSIVANLINQQDVEQIRRQNLQLEESAVLLREQSVRDHLTGLFNRRYLEETLERELRRAERAGSTVAVIMLDIDNFKRFNDVHGHHSGDAVLRAIGAFLRACVRDSDIACRYGGEEFTLILPGASEEIAVARAERLRSEIHSVRTEIDIGTLAELTLSLGVSVFPRDGSTGESLLAASDAALYAAKAAGRNRVFTAASSPTDALPPRAGTSDTPDLTG